MALHNADSQDSGSECAGSDSSSFHDIKKGTVSVPDFNSEPAPENLFTAFTDNEMMKRVEGMERDLVVKRFINGMERAGGETRVVAVHKNSSGLIAGGRFEAFRIFTSAVARKCGGNPNIEYGCYGGSKEEILEILAYGFSARNEAVRGRVHLAPVKFAVDAAAACGVDENGMRHLLICKVLLGNSEVIHQGINRSGPDSIHFDSGLDALLNPRKYIVWSGSMNTHICPAYVVTFKAPGGLEKYVAPPAEVYRLRELVEAQAMLLAPEKMALLWQWCIDVKDRKISVADLRRKLVVIGQDVMDLAMDLIDIRRGSFNHGLPAPSLVNLMKVLPRFLPASKMTVLANVCDDYEKKRISLAEVNWQVERVVDKNVLASAIKLIPGLSRRDVFVDALARFLPPSQMKLIFEYMEDYKSNKIGIIEFNRNFKLVVDDKVLASAVKLIKTSQQRNVTANKTNSQHSHTANQINSQQSHTAKDRKNVPLSQIYISDLLPFLESSLSTQKMALLTKSHEDFCAYKISRDQMLRRTALIVGEELFASAIKAYRRGQQNV